MEKIDRKTSNPLTHELVTQIQIYGFSLRGKIYFDDVMFMRWQTQITQNHN